MDLENIILSQIYMWNLKKWYKWTYLQNRNKQTIESKFMVIWGLRITVQGAQIAAATRTVPFWEPKRQEFLKENRSTLSFHKLFAKSSDWEVYIFFFFFLLQFIDWSSVPQICRWHDPKGRKQRESKGPSDEGERRECKNWLKTQYSKSQDHGIQSHHLMANKWGKIEKVTDCIFLGL